MKRLDHDQLLGRLSPILDAAAIRTRAAPHRARNHRAQSRSESVVLAGIPSRGVEIARRIAGFIRDDRQS